MKSKAKANEAKKKKKKNTPQNNRYADSVKMHFWSFGYHSFNALWGIAWTISKGVIFEFKVKFHLEGQG